MTSVQSSLDADPDEVDLSGLVESIVDSDEEEDLAESMDVSIVISPSQYLPTCAYIF